MTDKDRIFIAALLGFVPGGVVGMVGAVTAAVLYNRFTRS